MFSTRIVGCALFAWLTVASLSASAQAEKSESITTQPTSSIVPYKSVFSGYKGFQDPDLISWRQANDQVANAGDQGSHDMANMNAASNENDMSGMHGHDMSNARKENNKASKPAAGKGGKESKAMADMPNMKGMSNSEMKNMHNKMPDEKDKR